MHEFDKLSDTHKIILLTAGIQQKEEEVELVKELLRKNPDWSFIKDYTIMHGTAPLMYNYFKKHDLETYIPPTLYKNLKGNYMQTYAIHAIALDTLKEVFEVFHKNEIPTILLKGVEAATFIYNDPGLRPMGDVDIVVPPEKLLVAEALLFEMGFVYARPYKSKRLRTLNIHNHLDPFIKNGVKIELHRDLSSIHHVHRMPLNYVWKNVKEVDFYNTKVYLILNDAYLHYLCLHALIHFSNNIVRLNSFVDISEFIKKHEKSFNWSDIAQKSMLFKTTEPLYKALYIMHHYFRAPVPGSILEEIYEQGYERKIDESFLALLNNKPTDIAYSKPTSYLKKIRKIKGFHNKILYLWVELFPSREYMAYKYNLKSKNHVYPYYVYQFFFQLMRTVSNFLGIKSPK